MIHQFQTSTDMHTPRGSVVPQKMHNNTIKKHMEKNNMTASA
jgi:hypothetical protein